MTDSSLPVITEAVFHRHEKGSYVTGFLAGSLVRTDFVETLTGDDIIQTQSGFYRLERKRKLL